MMPRYKIIKIHPNAYIKTAVLTMILVLLGACSIFETDEEYSISDFDAGVSDGLMDNIYTVLIDTVIMAVIEPSDSAWTDQGIDSLMDIISDRDSIIAAVVGANAVLKPGVNKQRLISSASYASGYAILNLTQESKTENLVFFLSNHVTITIWNYDGKVINLTDDVFPSGMIVISDLTMARYEYDLDPMTYLIRFTKAETLLNIAVKEFELVVLSEGAKASTTAEKVCDMFQSNSAAQLELFSYGALDSNWIGFTIDHLNTSDSSREELVTVLEQNDAVLDANGLEELQAVYKEKIVTEICFILDLHNYNGFNAGFYLNDYFKVRVLSTTTGLEVLPVNQGIAFDEVGACSTLRQKVQFTLSNQKYLIALIKYVGAPDNSKFKMVILDEG
ncbi:MAG: hypothetical protein ABIA75_06290 [Candidatus Neomarinimicrobiota bacterium]